MADRHCTTEQGPFPSPERGLYGFVLYLIAYVFAIVYVLWAYIPTSWFHAVGLYYLPHKYWAIGAPLCACILIVLLVFCYNVLNYMSLPSINSESNFRDSYSRQQTENQREGSIAPLKDLPVSEVNRSLYLEK